MSDQERVRIKSTRIKSTRRFQALPGTQPRRAAPFASSRNIVNEKHKINVIYAAFVLAVVNIFDKWVERAEGGERPRPARSTEPAGPLVPDPTSSSACL